MDQPEPPTPSAKRCIEESPEQSMPNPPKKIKPAEEEGELHPLLHSVVQPISFSWQQVTSCDKGLGIHFDPIIYNAAVKYEMETPPVSPKSVQGLAQTEHCFDATSGGSQQNQVVSPPEDLFPDQTDEISHNMLSSAHGPELFESNISNGRGSSNFNAAEALAYPGPVQIQGPFLNACCPTVATWHSQSQLPTCPQCQPVAQRRSMPNPPLPFMPPLIAGQWVSFSMPITQCAGFCPHRASLGCNNPCSAINTFQTSPDDSWSMKNDEFNLDELLDDGVVPRGNPGMSPYDLGPWTP